MYNVQYAAQRGAHTVHCNTILITMYNVQYAAQRGAHTVHCQTIHVSTNTSTNTVGGAGAPLESLQPFQRYCITYPIYRGVRVKLLTPTTGSHSYLSTTGEEAGCLFLWVGEGWLEVT